MPVAVHGVVVGRAHRAGAGRRGAGDGRGHRGRLITMLKFWVALGRVPLAAVIVPVKVPAVVGVPEITPGRLWSARLADLRR